MSSLSSTPEWPLHLIGQVAGGGPYEALVTLRDSAGNVVVDREEYISESIPFASRVKVTFDSFASLSIAHVQVRARIGSVWMEDEVINSNGSVTVMVEYPVAGSHALLIISLASGRALIVTAAIL